VKPGVNRVMVKVQLDTIAARLAHDFPDTNAGHGLTAIGYMENRTEGARTFSWVIMGLSLIHI